LLEVRAVSDVNPKDAVGRTKVPLRLNPFSALTHMAHAFWDGARKYGPFNWRKKKVSAAVYIDAALRHIAAWQDGQECADDSGAHHLGHAMACLAIILDAKECGALIDDRPAPGPAVRLLEEIRQKIAAHPSSQPESAKTESGI
jgi:hypothetical protein